MGNKSKDFTQKIMSMMRMRKKGNPSDGKKQAVENKLRSTKAIIKKEREEILEMSSKVNLFHTLRFKMIASFLVPVIFIIILGVVSFSKASEGIQSNYEKATVETINMAGEYLRFGFESVKGTAVQYANDDAIARYFCNIGDTFEINLNRRNITTSLTAKQVTDEFIENVYLISDEVASITSSSVTIEKDFLSEFEKTELGTYLKNNKNAVVWDGEDAFLDERLKTDSSDYSMRLIRNSISHNALIIIDTKTDIVNEILADLQFDKSGYLGIVTVDGREIIDYSLKSQDPDFDVEALKAEKIFFNEDFYQEAVAAKESSGSKYVEYKGDTYLFMYSKIGLTGATLCALMPKATITSQADAIKNVTIIIVIIACLVAVVIAAWLSTGIDKVIKSIISKLKLAAKGDLTVQFDSKRKDEFRILIDEIQITFANMKGLIQQVKELSNEVSTAASNVSTTSELFLKSTEDISTAMNEIEQGINQQAKDAENCLLQMDSLSQKIEVVSMNTKEMGQIADSTKMIVKDGTIVSEELNQQTKSTIEITTDIIKEIENLSEKSSSITKIINVINDIANQTNLLSLNASIEAARAGEHGKGFAVVASEIRTLAEQSKNSVNEIKKIISSIQEDTKTAVETAQKAEKVLALQESAVKNTTDSYANINESVEKLVVSLSSIADNVANIEEARISTLGAIENISAVLEEIAASSNNVNQTASNQVASVENLNKSAMNLNSNSDHLVREVQKFTV